MLEQRERTEIEGMIQTEIKYAITNALNTFKHKENRRKIQKETEAFKLFTCVVVAVVATTIFWVTVLK